MAAVSFTGGAHYYLKWREADGALPMLLGGVLFATIAYLRRRALNRKKAALRQAVTRYEKMLAEPLS